MSTPQPYDGPAGPPPPPPPSARPPRRRGPARFAPLVVAAWAVLEIWLLLWVGSRIGALGVVLLLLAGVVVGGYVIKRAGRRAWRGLAESLQPPAAGDPAGARPDGSGNGLTMLAGLLLMFPGFGSDVLGLLLLLPPVRGLVRRWGDRVIARSAPRGGPLGDLNTAFTQARIHRPDGKVVQGEVIRDDDPPPTH
ncbi:FxsA family membrane protein [Streptomyces sp. NPDC051940]|uniref:FxsA family membrane protein n=1 Tax=Streptomyces sp. NPDC051940 TaxID=3155675 RepID=UPI00341F9C81